MWGSHIRGGIEGPIARTVRGLWCGPLRAPACHIPLWTLWRSACRPAPQRPKNKKKPLTQLTPLFLCIFSYLFFDKVWLCGRGSMECSLIFARGVFTWRSISHHNKQRKKASAGRGFQVIFSFFSRRRFYQVNPPPNIRPRQIFQGLRGGRVFYLEEGFIFGETS